MFARGSILIRTRYPSSPPSPRRQDAHTTLHIEHGATLGNASIRPFFWFLDQLKNPFPVSASFFEDVPMSRSAALNRTKSRRAFDSKLQKLQEGNEADDDTTGTTAADGETKATLERSKKAYSARPPDPYNVPKGRAKTGPVQESVFVNMQPLHFDECPHDEAQYGGLSPRRSLNVSSNRAA